MRRRELLASLAGAAAQAAMRWNVPAFAANGLFAAGTARQRQPDVEIALTAASADVPVLPGQRTRVFRYRASLLRGPASALLQSGDSWLGPTIRLRRGQRVRIRFTNELPEPSIVHWHGLDVPSAMDGHPHRVIGQGREYIYEFDVQNRAGMYWYHPHPDMRTGYQVYQGLAGLLIVDDDAEAALNLPAGNQELFFVLQDRTFDARNQLVYLRGGMMDQMLGFIGESVLTNGSENPTVEVETRAYRIRILNGSNARVYKLQWSSAAPITAIGVDGGLLERPVTRPYVMLAPAQRLDITVDLRDRQPGDVLEMRTVPFPVGEIAPEMAQMPGMRRGAGGMRAGAASAYVGATLFRLRVTRRIESTARLPLRLPQFDPTWRTTAGGAPRRIDLSFRAGRWMIDGRVFEMNSVDPSEEVRAGTSQIWEIRNTPGMMQSAHPIHVHGRQFRVLAREDLPGAPAAGNIRDGMMDDGLRDTVLVLPGQTVRLQMFWSRHPGLYLYHCHTLEHEDMGMMRNYRIIA
jgi:FtsP/CotA-like multicopper oxidase with cupredoxin domain